MGVVLYNKQPIIQCTPLHPVSTAPPFDESRLSSPKTVASVRVRPGASGHLFCGVLFVLRILWLYCSVLLVYCNHVVLYYSVL